MEEVQTTGTVGQAPRGWKTQYYEKVGRACDFIMRCNDCKKLALNSTMETSGGCPNCGNRRFTEVNALSAWEWFKIRVGLLRFPYWREFLAEFSIYGR